MQYPIKVLLPVALALFLALSYADELSRKRKFCGRRLSKMLATMCQTYPTPRGPSNNSIRIKRQVATECCHRSCSLEHLINFYCETVNKTALEEFMIANQENDTTTILPTTTPVQLRSKRLSRKGRRRNHNSHQVDGKSVEEYLDGPLQKTRGKRTCTCKKYRKYKKTKRTLLLNPPRPVQEPRIGEQEEAEAPFHVLNSYNF